MHKLISDGFDEDEPNEKLPHALDISMTEGVMFVLGDGVELTVSTPKVLRMLAKFIEGGKLD